MREPGGSGVFTWRDEGVIGVIYLVPYFADWSGVLGRRWRLQG